MSVTPIQNTNGEEGGVSKSVHDSSTYESVTKTQNVVSKMNVKLQERRTQEESEWM